MFTYVHSLLFNIENKFRVPIYRSNVEKSFDYPNRLYGDLYESKILARFKIHPMKKAIKTSQKC